MTYEDMARSHVTALVREAFGLEDVVVDEDGDIPFPCGTALSYASVVREGRLLRVWSRAVAGVHVGKQVLREINDANANATLVRVYATGSAVWVEGSLPVECLRVPDVRALCLEVGTTADRLGSLLATVHGGQVTWPEGLPVGSDGDG